MAGDIAAIHQPNYLPWIGYFHKILESDVFVLLDDVEHSRGSWIDRNRIKTPDGWTWLTVPTQSADSPIHETRIATTENWRDEHWKSFTHNYGGATHIDDWKPFLRETYETEWEHIHELDVHIVEEICDRLDLEADFRRSSELQVDATGAKRLAILCAELDVETYLCGMGADDYMDESVFEERGVEVEYQSFEHPTYTQRFGAFEPNLSFIDACLNLGADRARELLDDL